MDVLNEALTARDIAISALNKQIAQLIEQRDLATWRAANLMLTINALTNEVTQLRGEQHA